MKKTKILALIMSIVMLAGLLTSFAVSANAASLATLDGRYTVESGKLTLVLTLSNNPGINTLVIDLGYDSTLLTLDSITNGEIFSEANGGSLFDVNTENNPLILYFDENGIENITANGTLATIVFTVKSESDNYGLTLTVEDKNTYGCGEDITPVDIPFATPTVKEKPDVIPGDIDGDGKVNAVDANLIKQIIIDIFTPTPEEFAAADIDGDGKVNAADANMLKMIIVGIDE